MKIQLDKWKKKVSAFHREESGEQAMSTVMLMAIAALVVVLLIAIGTFVVGWWNTSKGKIKQDPGWQS